MLLCTTAQASFKYHFRPSSSRTASFSSDERKVSTLAEIIVYAGELLVAAPGGCVATLA